MLIVKNDTLDSNILEEKYNTNLKESQGSELEEELIIEYNYDELPDFILEDLRKYNITKEVFYAAGLRVFETKSKKFLYKLFKDRNFVDLNYTELIQCKLLYIPYYQRYYQSPQTQKALYWIRLYPNTREDFFIFDDISDLKNFESFYIPLNLCENKSILYIVDNEYEAIQFNSYNKFTVALLHYKFRSKEFNNLINFIFSNNIKKICIVIDEKIKSINEDEEKVKKLYEDLCRLAIKLILLDDIKLDVKLYDALNNREIEVYDLFDHNIILKILKSEKFNILREILFLRKVAQKSNRSLKFFLDMYKFSDDDLRKNIFLICEKYEKELIDVIDMLSTNNLIESIKQDFKNLYKNEKLAMLFYFILMSRKVLNLNRNFIVNLRGNAKHYFISNILNLISRDDIIHISYLSNKALYYFNDKLFGKVLRLSDFNHEMIDILTRIVFDRKLITYSVDFQQQEHKIVKKELDCKTVILCEDLENYLINKKLRDVIITFNVNCDTRDIVKLKLNQNVKSIQIKYRILDIFLKSHKVYIPYELIEKYDFGFNLIDFEMFEDLVKISAVLHQHTRKFSEDKIIVVEQDVEIARALFDFLKCELVEKSNDEDDEKVEFVLNAIKFFIIKKKRYPKKTELVKYLSKKMKKSEETIKKYLLLLRKKNYIKMEGKGRKGAKVIPL